MLRLGVGKAIFDGYCWIQYQIRDIMFVVFILIL